MTPDHINSLFEGGGAILIWLNVLQLHRDKQVKGVHVGPVMFFWAWGVWNLYFYPSVGAFWSFVAGIGVMIANGIWLGQMIYYRRRR